MELLGVRICFSHIAQYCRKLAAMSGLLASRSSGTVTLSGDPAGADLLLNEAVRLDAFPGLFAWLVGDFGDWIESFMKGGEA